MANSIRAGQGKLHRKKRQVSVLVLWGRGREGDEKK